jgi:hypothetical protein
VTERPDVQVRRSYDDPAADDGIRVLVDRRWPRGVSQARAALDEGCTAVAPSDASGKWYGHSSSCCVLIRRSEHVVPRPHRHGWDARGNGTESRR